MNYWVIKGRPSNNWDKWLVPGKGRNWHTGRAPKGWSSGDRIFCWESGSVLRIIGLAELMRTDMGFDEQGHTVFRIRHLTTRLPNTISLSTLRAVPILNEASFVKSGPATTLFPLRDDQASLLFNLLVRDNPKLAGAGIWSDLIVDSAAENAAGVIVLDSDTEGGAILAAHFRRERSQKLIAEKKRQVLAAKGRLQCEVCNFDFKKAYGERGKEFCEVHHIRPMSENRTETITKLTDLAILCANCHRMLHRKPWFDMLALRQIMMSQASGAMKHKKYSGTVEYSTEDEMFHGIIRIKRDIVSYGGNDLAELAHNFRDATDEYLAFCKAEGRTPNSPVTR